MDINVIIDVMIELFILIFIGYVLYKFKLFDKSFNQKITKLVLHVTMPALIINSVLEQTSKPSKQVVYTTFGVSIAMFLLLPIVGIILAKLIRAEKKKQGLYAFMMTFSNIGFMGFPVISSLFGATAVFYTAIINIIFNVATFSIGVILLRYGGGAKAKFNINNLLKPGVLFSALAIVIYFMDITFPPVVENTISRIGATTTPLAMLLMGSTLASMNLIQIFNEGKVYLFCIIKQIIIPVILYPTVKYFVHDSLLFGVVMVLLMMPVATNAIMFAIECEADEKLAAKSVFISTVLSIVSIPALIYFLNIM